MRPRKLRSFSAAGAGRLDRFVLLVERVGDRRREQLLAQHGAEPRQIERIGARQNLPHAARQLVDGELRSSSCALSSAESAAATSRATRAESA
jgi:hypothetical protein